MKEAKRRASKKRADGYPASCVSRSERAEDASDLMWLKRARAGKLHYRPLDEYALREYSVTRKELDHFVRTADRQIARDQKAGKIKIYSSNLEADLAA